MKEIKVKFFIKSQLGALIGVAICLIIYGLGGYDELLTDKPAFIAQFIGSMLMGFVGMGGSVAYEIDSWGISKATLVHYVATMGIFVLNCSLLHWFEGSALLISLICMTIAYFCIWLVNYILGKKEISRINSDIEKMIREEKEGEHL